MARSETRKPEPLDFDYFSPDLFANFNSGAAERAMEAKNRTESFARSRWSWWRIGLGVLIGTVFAFVNLYNALLVGVVVGGSWYLSYFLGMALRWRPNDINLAAGASTGASQVVVGFAFTYPALFLLSDYAPDGTIDRASLPSLWFLVAASLFAAFLGIGYFLVWRRLWLVDRPLPYPGFETSMELLAIANARNEGTIERARVAIRRVVASTGIIALFTFLRDWPLGRAGAPVLDRVAGSRAYGAGDLSLPLTTNAYPVGILTLSPLLAATGWFIGLRVAVAFFVGSAFAFWVLAPFAVDFGVVPETLGAPVDHWSTAKTFLLDFLGAGVIAGAGLLVLWRNRGHFLGAFRDLRAARVRREARPGAGWYEAPTWWLGVLVAATLVGFPLLYLLAGENLAIGMMTGLALVVGIFVFGAIAVKITGETTVQPTSPMSILMMLALAALLGVLYHEAVLVPAVLLGVTLFAAGVTMSTDMLLDFKNALYVGTRPHLQMMAEVFGVVPGVIVGVVAGTALSIGIAQGDVDLPAPKAQVFATLAQSLGGGDADWLLLGLGLLMGIVVEGAIGLGIPFGIGMFLTPSLTMPFLLFGALRWGYDRRVLAPLPQTERHQRLLGTYMWATGAFVGEALLALLLFAVTVAPDIRF